MFALRTKQMSSIGSTKGQQLKEVGAVCQIVEGVCAVVAWVGSGVLMLGGLIVSLGMLYLTHSAVLMLRFQKRKVRGKHRHEVEHAWGVLMGVGLVFIVLITQGVLVAKCVESIMVM